MKVDVQLSQEASRDAADLVWLNASNLTEDANS
jgi:hypothetical protein